MKAGYSSRIIAAASVFGMGLLTASCQKQAAPTGVTALYDLTVLSVSAPATAAQGSTISVIHTTKNVGTGPASSSTSKFYLCTNNVACGYVNSQAVGALAAGASSTLTNASFTVPAGQPLGTNYVVVVCGTNLSDDKSNNTNSTVIVITQ